LQRARDTAKRQAMRHPELALTLVGVDAVTIEIGADLAHLLVPPLADALLDRIGEVRRALAADVGVVLPGVRLRDDLARDPATYAIRVRDRIAGQGRLELERAMAVADESVLQRLNVSIETEPVYGLPCAWIAPELRDRAQNAGALVFDPISVLGSHLAEIARAHAAELVGRQEFATLLEHLRASVPSVVKEIGGEALPFSSAHRAYATLLAEGVWPRDPVRVFEAMVDAGTRDPRELAEAARRATVPDLLRRRGVDALAPLLFDPEFERAVLEQPQLARDIVARIAEYSTQVPRERAAVICTAHARPLIAELLRGSGVRVEVFSYVELPVELALEPAGVLRAA
jgi:flagellar biosynthesis protein FlhA